MKTIGNNRGQLGAGGNGSNGLTNIVVTVAVALLIMAVLMPIGLNTFAATDLSGIEETSSGPLAAGENTDLPQDYNLAVDSTDVGNGTSTITVTYTPTGDSHTQTMTVNDTLAINDYDAQANTTSTYQASLTDAPAYQISFDNLGDLDSDGTTEGAYTASYYQEAPDGVQDIWNIIPIIMILAVVMGAIFAAIKPFN